MPVTHPQIRILLKYFRYGICYVFNFVNSSNMDNVLKSHSDGPDYGLSINIGIERSYYMRYGLSRQDGIIIALASKAQMPNLLSTPIQIGKSL